MKLASRIMIALIALEHLWFLVLEMFLFNRPTGLEAFKITQELADAAAPLAANQGLYNGFLVAGLVWSLFAADPAQARQLRFFFLGCVVAAGAYGGATLDRAILTGQALPAAVALILVWAAGRKGEAATAAPLG